MRNTVAASLWLLAAYSGGLCLPAAGEALPPPVDLPPAVAGVDSPGGAALPAMAGAATPGAPAIAAISDVTFPDETLVMTGEGLEGAALRLWAEGATFDVEPFGWKREARWAPRTVPVGRPLGLWGGLACSYIPC
ncbi:MAG: hypothetical protein ACOC1F_04270 [Myxococcota bacterium]